MPKSFQEFICEKMSKVDLEKRQSDLERSMAELVNDIKKYKKSGDTDSLEIAQDTYDVYKKKHDAVTKSLKTAK